MTGTDLGLVALILGTLILGVVGWSKRDARRARLLSSGLPLRRPWRSRTPDDCVHCRTEALTLLAGAHLSESPWPTYSTKWQSPMYAVITPIAVSGAEGRVRNETARSPTLSLTTRPSGAALCG
jgi:hypothetical protein